MRKETLSTIITFTSIGLVGLVLPFFSFPRELKDAAIAENNSRCQSCGRQLVPNKLFAHHILPEQFGGASTMVNLYIVCSGCHTKADWNAIHRGNLVNNLSVPEVIKEDPEIIGNIDKYNKAARRFNRRVFV